MSFFHKVDFGAFLSRSQVQYRMGGKDDVTLISLRAPFVAHRTGGVVVAVAKYFNASGNPS